MNVIIKFMKWNYKIFIVILCLFVILFVFKINVDKIIDLDLNKDKMFLEILVFVIEKGYYSFLLIDDIFFKGIFKDYIDVLDFFKCFFL